jgi:hypothetical protein
MKNLNLLFIAIVLLLFTVACSHKPDINLGETIGKTEEFLRQLEEIDSTSSSFNGKRDIYFRLMVNEHPTEEAIKLFNQILDNFVIYSNHTDVWNYYNGYFDIKS